MGTINVGISDLNIAREPDVLATYALGSCVGICLYDEKIKLAGLAHIMLPWSAEASNTGDNARRFADTGITELISMMCRNGTSVNKLTAKIAGGAQMFKTKSAVFNIGDRNVAAVKKVLSSYKIPIIAEQTGENYGRTVFFYSANGKMEIRAATRPTIIV
ncbi:MAG: chemotaxis protein CheD [Oscillospiraceae bacterium]|nr:chemotaxis protein CheD [Oscillospiraceae bacterium]MBQ4312406.1 chemotaxis protein CheD [Oscillospiraceae bacterium]MCR5165869.1 chemotaxis protein CheD [Oscillospiraceae bacterium]